jgi:signal transduction histidine kinase
VKNNLKNGSGNWFMPLFSVPKPIRISYDFLISALENVEISTIRSNYLHSLQDEAYNTEAILALYEKHAQNVESFILKIIQKNSELGIDPQTIWDLVETERKKKDMHFYRDVTHIMPNYPPASGRIKNLLYFSDIFEFMLKIIYRKDDNIVFATVIFSENISEERPSFYTSGYPWSDTSILPQNFDLEDQPFYSICIPKNNPERATKWTAPYEDPLGRGRMISCSHPIYVENEFIGIVELDITLEKIRLNLLQSLVPKKGCTLAVWSTGEIINIFADNEELECIFKTSFHIDIQLLKKISSRADTVHKHELAGKLYHIIAHKLVHVDMYLIRIIPSSLRSFFRALSLNLTKKINAFSKNIRKKIDSIVPAEQYAKNVDQKNDHISTSENEIEQTTEAFLNVVSKLKKKELDLHIAMKKISQSERLESFNRMTTSLIHEIRNPLSTINAYVHILFQKTGYSPFLRDYLEIISEELDRVSSHIKTLQSISRESEMNFEYINFENYLDKIIAIYEKIGQEKNIKILKKITPVGTVRIDTSKIQEAITNILFNAFDAIKQDGTVTISSQIIKGSTPNMPFQIYGMHKYMILIRIQDDGPGIPGHLVDKIFDPFFTTKPVGKGTGLGLSIAMKTIEEHEGFMTAHNHESGAVFQIYLPFKSDEGP